MSTRRGSALGTQSARSRPGLVQNARPVTGNHGIHPARAMVGLAYAMLVPMEEGTDRHEPFDPDHPG
jgi:hypothetical protein